MSNKTKRTTIYLDVRLHKALRLKAAETDRSVSDLVNDAIQSSLAEELEDLTAFDERADEPNLRFNDVLKELKRDGRI
ncbi:MAG: ribbon-helix-helix protein, CopG family [Candidatus Marinimicrobia bacterium]|nr:ribbon-helix-helix protein, CopG family [Candidatus Neomarinimicrobiota bacterium]